MFVVYCRITTHTLELGATDLLGIVRMINGVRNTRATAVIATASTEKKDFLIVAIHFFVVMGLSIAVNMVLMSSTLQVSSMHKGLVIKNCFFKTKTQGFKTNTKTKNFESQDRDQD